MQATYSRARQAGPVLSLTAIPVVFDNDSIEGGELPYTSEEQLRNLRDDSGAAHAFHRAGDLILTVPRTKGTKVIGKPRRLSVSKDRLGARLVRESLLRYFEGLPYWIRRRGPIELVATSRNLIPRLVEGASSEGPVSAGLYPSYRLDVRMLFPRGKAPVCVMAVDSRLRASIMPTAAKLLQSGFEFEGKYVVSPGDGGLLGCVVGADGDSLTLADYRESDRIGIDACLLEPRMENLLAYVSFATGVDQRTLRTRLDSVSKEIVTAEGKKGALGRLHNHLCEVGSFEAADGVTFKFGSVLGLNEKSGFTPTKLSTPSFVFHPTGNKTSRWHDNGLNEYGPFDAEFFGKKHPRFAVITPGEFQGQVEIFLRQLKDGIPGAKRFEKGLVRKYHLNGCEFEIFPFSEGSDPAQSYREACLKAVGGKSFDCAIVVIREEFHDLYGERNPYLVTKAALMSQGLPVQEVEIETIKGRGLEYVLNNLALACYGKLGGIPYTIAATPPLAHELVIGLGSVDLQRSRLGASSKVVGITTVFNADGTYLLANAAKEVPYESYVDELKASLASCIDETSKRNAWQDGDKLRLVFHVFKPLKDSEARAVKAFVESLTNYEVEFAFLTLTHEHPLTMIDEDGAGAYDYEYKVQKGQFVPQRGWAVRIGSHEMLLALTGPNQLKTPYQGCPDPVLIKLHRESTFNDLDYLGHQVFKFSFLSWRSFFPSTLPVTTSYSELIGRLLGQLNGLPNWNPDMLRTRLRTSRWFL